MAALPSPQKSSSASTATPAEEAWSGAIRAGDLVVFEAFFRATYSGVLRFAERLAPDGDAADLVQEAYGRLWERRVTLDPARSVRGLLFRTVRNLAYNRTRDVRTRRARLAERFAGSPQAYGHSPHPKPDEVTGGVVLAERMRTWIAALPERQREALMLSRFEGLSHAEISEVMGVSPRTVNNHLVQALRVLRDRVRDYAPHLL